MQTFEKGRAGFRAWKAAPGRRRSRTFWARASGLAALAAIVLAAVFLGDGQRTDPPSRSSGTQLVPIVTTGSPVSNEGVGSVDG